MSAIRHQITITASPRSVWRALTTEEGVTSWWVDQARIEARAGGRIVLTSEGEDGSPIEERGIFHSIQPTRKIEIVWDTNSQAPTKGTRIEFIVGLDGEETRVSVVHSGHGILDDAEKRAELDKGWKQALQALRDSLEG